MLGEWTAEQVIGGLEAAFRRNPDAAMYSVSPVSDLPCEGRIEDPHLIQATALALGLDSPARIHLLYHARALGTGESIYKLCQYRSWSRPAHYRRVTAASIAVAEWLNARAMRVSMCPDPRDFLMAAKAPGKKPGNPNLAAARKRAVEDNKSAASRYAANVLPVVREIQASGVKSLRSVARALTARGIPTARGGTWTPAQVSAILRRGG
jgi:Recombinase